MQMREVSASDVGCVVRYRLSADKAWASGRLLSLIGNDALVAPKWGSARRCSIDNVRRPA